MVVEHSWSSQWNIFVYHLVIYANLIHTNGQRNVENLKSFCWQRNKIKTKWIQRLWHRILLCQYQSQDFELTRMENISNVKIKLHNILTLSNYHIDLKKSAWHINHAAEHLNQYYYTKNIWCPRKYAEKHKRYTLFPFFNYQASDYWIRTLTPSLLREIESYHEAFV